MSSKIQKNKEETKNTVLDQWSIHEQLCLVSVVACSEDQNWVTVSRALKGIVFSSNSRPADWFLSKNCAMQYEMLLESIEAPKRRKKTQLERNVTSLEQASSTAVESLVEKLTKERIIELKKLIFEEQEIYRKLNEEIKFLQNSSNDHPRIREIWNEIERESIQIDNHN